MKRLLLGGAVVRGSRGSLASLASLVLVAGSVVGSVAIGPSAVAEGSADAASASARPRFVQPTTSITPARGCIVLRPGFNGIKVRMVQRRLGMGSRFETMDSATVARVQRFQRRHRLQRRDGVVDRRTWRAMGFRHGFCVDRWQADPALPLRATRRQRVNTMLDFALSYRGAEYVWGGAGRPHFGVDCSGLVLQSLYRAGLDPQPISIDKHVRPHYRTSLEIYTHPRLRHVPLAKRRRGDLVFYTKNSTGRVNHVALLLGRGRVVQAKGANVHTARLRRHYPGQTITRTVVRPFR